MSGRRQSQRERVYCHRCESEWFHDEQGLSPCPECNNQITEILDSEDDPRLSDAPSPFQSAPSPHRHPFADHNPWHQNPFGTQDPDEDDIHHFQFGLGNGRFWTGSPQPPNNRGGLPPFPGNMFGPNMFGNFHPGMPPTPPPDRSRGPGSDTRPEGLDHVVSSFTNMLNSMGGMDRFNMEWEDANPHNAQNRGPNGQPSRPERTRSTPGFRRRSPSDAGPGSPRIEIYATSSNMDQPLHIRSSARRVNPNDLNNRGGPVPFEDLSQLVGSIFGHHVNSTSQSPTGNGPAPAASTIFSALSAMMNRNVAAANGVEMGDAVFSDEALDRIMSQLMNDHPTGGAPPPASTEAIDALPRVKATKTHLGEEGKADCTICTEEIKNSLYNTTLRQSNQIKQELTSLTDSPSTCTPAVQGQLSASLTSFSRKIDDYNRLAHQELAPEKQEKAYGRVKNFKSELTDFREQLDQLKKQRDDISSSQNRNELLGRRPHNSSNTPENPYANATTSNGPFRPSASSLGASPQDYTRETHAFREQSFMSSTNTQLDEFLDRGRAVLGDLGQQREMLKGTQKKLYSVANTLGISGDTIRMVERRAKQDKWIFWGGVLVFVVFVWLVLRYLR
ncbi:MAG: protein transport protein bos1 [Chrysothrix sp. TS-e1954]|nr:MAG: protein transport protein bos1 [Chrysothrix sp. TS-e1954]